MLLKFLNFSSSMMLGIDISSTCVKLLELSHHDNRYRVESYAVEPLPPGVVVEKVIKDTDALAEAVTRALSKSHSSTKQAAVAVPNSFAMTRVIQMDASLTEDEMESQILLESDKYIPQPLEEINLDFSVIGPAQNNKDLVDVLLVASHSENVDILVRSLAKVGLTVRVVDVESYAVGRACGLVAESFPNRGVDEAIAVIDIGSIMTNLTVIHNFSTIFTREDVFGGEQLTRAIQRHYGLSYAEAGLAKKKGGLPDDYEAEILNPFKESAVLHIRRALQFFFSSSQHNKVSHILLAGGSVMIPGFADLVEDQIGIPTTIANPFSMMSVANHIELKTLTRDASALLVCCGLAMRSIKT